MHFSDDSIISTRCHSTKKKNSSAKNDIKCALNKDLK